MNTWKIQEKVFCFVLLTLTVHDSLNAQVKWLKLGIVTPMRYKCVNFNWNHCVSKSQYYALFFVWVAHAVFFDAMEHGSSFKRKQIWKSEIHDWLFNNAYKSWCQDIFTLLQCFPFVENTGGDLCISEFHQKGDKDKHIILKTKSNLKLGFKNEANLLIHVY